MKKRFCDFKNLDFSDCREITDDELFKINGGKQVENSNEAVAQAQVGDTLIRDDETQVTLTQGDIDWAQAHCSGENTNSNNSNVHTELPQMTQTPIDSSGSNEKKSEHNCTNIDSDRKVWLCRNVNGVDEIFCNENITTNQQAKKAYGKSAYILDDGQQYGPFLFYNNKGNLYITDKLGNTINQIRPIQGDNYAIFPGSAIKQGVNPDTLHKNLMGTSYTGPKNPTDYKNNPNFDYRPYI